MQNRKLCCVFLFVWHTCVPLVEGPAEFNILQRLHLLRCLCGGRKSRAQMAWN